MSQVDEFHYHTPGAVPWAVRECDDLECAEARAGIEQFARLDQEWLERQITLHEQAIRRDTETLSRLREAIKLKAT